MIDPTTPAWAGLSALLVWVVALAIWAHYRRPIMARVFYRFPGFRPGRRPRVGFRPRTRWRPLLYLLAALAGWWAAAPEAHGQTSAPVDTARVRALVNRNLRDLDSVARDRTAPLYSRRAQARIRARQDSILRAVIPVVVTPPPPPPPPPGPVAATVAIHSNGTSVAVGSTLQLEAEVKTAAGAVITPPVTWGVAPATLATITTTGLLRGVAGGTVTVTARADTTTGRRVYTVTGPQPPPPDTTTPLPPPPPDTTAPAPGGMIGVAEVAELPRTLPPASYPATGRAVRVPLIGNLQFYLDNATSGDVLLLPPGATYIGNFVLRDKGAAQSWIVVRTDTTLSTAGRMTPSAAMAHRLARILTPNNVPAIGTEHGAHHWVFAGVELGITPTAVDVNGIIRIGGAPGQDAVSKMAHHFILDRVWVHGTPTGTVRRCVSLQSGAAAVLDSWLDDCHTNNGDSQAIVSWDGTGPFLIRNNYLAAGHEVIMFGGANSAIVGLVPSDITIERNHITRPASWNGVWQQKNLVETKNVRRLLVEGNVIENIRPDAQAGFGGLFKSVNQSPGSAYWSVSEHITVRYNIWRNMANGWNFAGLAETPAVAANHLTFSHNLLDTVNVNPPWTGGDGSGIPLQILGNLHHLAFHHNTIAGGEWGLVQFDGARNNPRMAWAGNAMACGGYGIKGSGMGSGPATLAAFAPGYSWSGNAVWGCDPVSVPTGTAIFPSRASAEAAVGPDGLPYGADLARIRALTAGVVVAP